jgi:hypothetical protein
MFGRWWRDGERRVGSFLARNAGVPSWAVMAWPEKPGRGRGIYDEQTMVVHTWMGVFFGNELTVMVSWLGRLGEKGPPLGHGRLVLVYLGIVGLYLHSLTTALEGEKEQFGPCSSDAHDLA